MAGPRAPLRRAVVQTRTTAHALRHLGLRTVGLIAANSARRQLHHARHRRAGRRLADPMTPGELERVEVWQPHQGAVLFHFERGVLEVAFLAADVVRTSWGPGPAALPYALAGDRPPWPVPDVQAHPLDALRAQGPWVLRSAALEVRVSPDGSVGVSRPGGAALCRESGPARRGAAWEQRLTFRPGEQVGGLGEQSAGVDLRGVDVRLWNRDPGGSWSTGTSPLYLGIPVMVCTHRDGDLLTFWENTTDATMRWDGEDTAVIAFAGGALRRYAVTGSVPHLLDRYTELTGRPALPPRWALGYHQSRWGYRTDADVRAVADGYRQLGLPLSAVHLDIDHMRGFRVFTVDEERFPDVARLAADLSRQGTRLVTIVDPGVKVDPAYDVYREGRDQHRFCTDGRGHVVEGVVWPGRCAYPDFTDPAARSWWAGLYRRLTEAGVGGVWHDMNEPTSIALLGDPTLPLDTRHHLDGRGGDHAEAHNVYGLLMNRAGFNGLRTARPERRPFIVSRSGWAGMQRYAWSWTGDSASTWASMRQQVATVVGLGLSGVPYSGSDIGGFGGVPDDELYLRWLQMGVCMPFCRTHSVLGVPPREPWCFDQPAAALVAAWVRFRYRLLPYLYTLAHGATERGEPVVRPLWWPLPAGDPPPGAEDDAASSHGAPSCDDAFLLGDALLVAPITERGARQRSVPLPAGSWTSVWGDEVVATDGGSGAGAPEDGGSGAGGSGACAATVVCAAPLERLPLLARAGSVVPLDDGWAESGGPCCLEGDEGLGGDDGPGPTARASDLAFDHAPQLLGFHCWPDEAGDAAGGCVDDAGDGTGPVRHDRVRLHGAEAGSTARVVWERSGDFPAPSSVRVVVHGWVPARAEADGVEVPVSGAGVLCPAFEELSLHDLVPAPPAHR